MCVSVRARACTCVVRVRTCGMGAHVCAHACMYMRECLRAHVCVPACARGVHAFLHVLYVCCVCARVITSMHMCI